MTATGQLEEATDEEVAEAIDAIADQDDGDLEDDQEDIVGTVLSFVSSTESDQE